MTKTNTTANGKSKGSSRTKAQRKHRPGRELELEVQNLLRNSGFRAQIDARPANPRQTDVFAQGNDLTLLVEVKDRKRVVDINDIDGLRSRLGRTTPDMIGVIVTSSSISRSAIKEIESNRTREILVINAFELGLIRTSKARLLNLLNKKRSELRVYGRAWFRKSEGGEYLGVALPRPTMEFVSVRGTSGLFCAKAGFAHSGFSAEIPDTGFGNPTGEGVRLTLSLDQSTLDEIRDLIGYVHDNFGLSSNGAFSIHQSGACWHGFGIKSLLATVPDPWARYRVAGMERAHHSESISYFDQFRNGWIALTTQQRVPDGPKAPAYFHQSDLCIQLPGIPVDVAPYLALCRYTGNDWAEFKPVTERLTRTVRLKRPIKLDVIGTLVRNDDDRENDRWVIGLIARNPFHRKKKLPPELKGDGNPLGDLLEMDILFCDLKDHIEEGDQVDYVELKGFETTDAQYVQIIRPFGTWNEIVKRVHETSTIGPPMAKRASTRRTPKSR
jgi:hypothetical protein